MNAPLDYALVGALLLLLLVLSFVDSMHRIACRRASVKKIAAARADVAATHDRLVDALHRYNDGTREHITSELDDTAAALRAEFAEEMKASQLRADGRHQEMTEKFAALEQNILSLLRPMFTPDTDGEIVPDGDPVLELVKPATTTRSGRTPRKR